MSTNYYAVNASHVGQTNFDPEKYGVHIGKTYLGPAGQHFITRGYGEEERPGILGVPYTQRWGHKVTSLRQWAEDIEASDGRIVVMSEYYYLVGLDVLADCVEDKVVYREFC